MMQNVKAMEIISPLKIYRGNFLMCHSSKGASDVEAIDFKLLILQFFISLVLFVYNVLL